MQLTFEIMKSILEIIVRTTGDYLGHFGPLTANGAVESPDGSVFEGGEVGTFETWVEMIYILEIERGGELEMPDDRYDKLSDWSLGSSTQSILFNGMSAAMPSTYPLSTLLPRPWRHSTILTNHNIRQ